MTARQVLFKGDEFLPLAAEAPDFPRVLSVFGKVEQPFIFAQGKQDGVRSSVAKDDLRLEVSRHKINLTEILRSGNGLILLAVAALMPLSADAQDGVVARLGGSAIISEADLSGWSAAQACYGEGALTSRRAAFMRLSEAALADKAMREHGGPAVDDQSVAEDAARIDRETQAPDILACIKGALGKDYRRVFVRPSLTESRLRLFLMRDPKVQGPARQKAVSAQKRALAGEGLEAVSKELGLYYSSATYSLNPATAPYRPEVAPAEYQKDFIEKHLSKLADGEFLDEPVESDYTFQAVRLLRRDGKGWLFEAAVARKVGQEEWFAGLRKARLEIFDAELREWVKGIKGNPRLKAVEVGP